MGKKKEDLQEICRSHGINFTTKDTKANLVKKILTVQMG